MSDAREPIAVPAHVSHAARRDASPGLSFGMLIDAWDWQGDSIRKDESRLTPGKLGTALSLDGHHERLLKALGERQQHALTQYDERCRFVIDAEATAPFSTGLGNAHPTENGFTFSLPHGLPFLPGSGVKGVVRAAALELARGDPDSGWKEALIDVLFGWAPEGEGDDETVDLEAAAEATDDGMKGDRKRGARGALSFHDVFPQCAGTQRQLLEVDVMTPHQSHYLAEGDTPHDYGQPNPILFVTVAPGARFTFHVVCDPVLLRTNLDRIAPTEAMSDEGWKVLVEGAFEHAFDWLGFGAKTAVGYGAMRIDERAQAERRERVEARHHEETTKRERETRHAGMDAIDRKFDDELAKVTQAHPEHEEVVRRVNALDKGDWSDATAEQRVAAERLREWMRDKGEWAEESKKKNPSKDRKHQRTLVVQRIIGDA